MRNKFKKSIERAEKKIKITFTNKDILLNSLTHTSYLAEKKEGLITNERLEFLGDSVLGVIITKELYDRFPDFTEGDLAKLRANIVNSETLASVAEILDIGPEIIMGRGTVQSGGRSTVSILENAFEAIVGAIFLDKGFPETKRFILNNFDEIINKKSKLKDFSDAKTALQEKAVDLIGTRPIYQIIEERGPYHDRMFVSQVRIDNKVYGTGEGKSKKKAEQQAALEAIKKLKAKS